MNLRAHLTIVLICMGLTNCQSSRHPQNPPILIPGDATLRPGDADVTDAAGDAEQGDPLPTPPVIDGTESSRTQGFQFFYRERVLRQLEIVNRLGMAGDVGFAVAIAHMEVAKSGNAWEVVVGPKDNNPMGRMTYEIAQTYRALGGRELELTLIRMFEGLVFLEQVSGHWGLTSRMAVPGYDVHIDGTTQSISRTRDGAPIASPAQFSSTLEQEILRTFFANTTFDYWLDPARMYPNRHAVNRMSDYAITYVFSEPPKFLRVSNCCASYIVSQAGAWRGAYWSNHNSRDNFSDLMIGYMAAKDLLTLPNLPLDLRTAATHAAAAGTSVGNRVVSDGFRLMTVSEYKDYNELIPGGSTRPDLREVTQDLGTLNDCFMGYLAVAMSAPGLDTPVPELTLNDSANGLAIRALLQSLGVNAGSSGGSTTCKSLDTAFGGGTWEEFLASEVNDRSWSEVALTLAAAYPETIAGPVSGAMDDFQNMELGAIALVYYAEMSGKAALRQEALTALDHILTFHRVLSDILIASAQGDAGTIASAQMHRYKAAVIAANVGLPVPVADLANLAYAENEMARREGWQQLGDTAPLPLLTSADIAAAIQAELTNEAGDAPWIVERYNNRFASGPPIRPAGDGYEVVNLAGQWQSVPNGRHVHYGESRFAFEIPACNHSPDQLSCSWARLGCVAADVDNSGTVDAADTTLFELRRTSYTNTQCTPENHWCGGADLDRNFTVNNDDAAFLRAAQGCRR